MNTQHPTDANGLDELLDALRHPLRRQILTQLKAREPPESFGFEELIGDSARDSDAISLIHNHLPMLADFGLIDWNRKHNTVRRGPQFEEVESIIDALESHKEDFPAN